MRPPKNVEMIGFTNEQIREYAENNRLPMIVARRMVRASGGKCMLGQFEPPPPPEPEPDPVEDEG